eukprot:2648914-Rhodomonas_salina.1
MSGRAAQTAGPGSEAGGGMKRARAQAQHRGLAQGLGFRVKGYKHRGLCRMHSLSTEGTAQRIGTGLKDTSTEGHSRCTAQRVRREGVKGGVSCGPAALLPPDATPPPCTTQPLHSSQNPSSTLLLQVWGLGLHVVPERWHKNTSSARKVLESMANSAC